MACDHNCESCSSNCADRKPESLLAPQNANSNIKKVIGIVSGKGGVGKSLVTALSAVISTRRGYNTAILDADITGPSIPKMFGINKRAEGSELGILPCVSKMGVKIMSLNLLLENESDPVIWRGSLIAGTVKQFWTDVVWEDVDFMFVDMPPGTGDVPLTVFQSLPVDGIIVVASPQELVGMIVEKAVKMAALMNIPVLGLVENMSYIKCPDCGKEFHIFGSGKTETVADELGVDLLARIPIDTDMATLIDNGMFEKLQNNYFKDAATYIDAKLNK